MSPTRLAALGLLALACGAPDLYEGMPEHVQRRHVQLEGAHNFRDLGGYATEDGRTVRWGLFYRSDHLAQLTDARQLLTEATRIAAVAGCGGAKPIRELVELTRDRRPLLRGGRFVAVGRGIAHALREPLVIEIARGVAERAALLLARALGVSREIADGIFEISHPFGEPILVRGALT